MQIRTTRENKRFAAGVHAIASDNAAASSASRRACDASAFASGLVALTSASFAEAFAPAAASCSLNLSASPSAATYIFVSLNTEKSLTFKTSIKVCFKASLSSSDRTRSPKTRNPSWASSSYPLDFRFAHRKRSLAVTKPSFPANARDAARRRCKSCFCERKRSVLCWAMYGQTVHSGQSANVGAWVWETRDTYPHHVHDF